jgi:hypothetical protein
MKLFGPLMEYASCFGFAFCRRFRRFSAGNCLPQNQKLLDTFGFKSIIESYYFSCSTKAFPKTGPSMLRQAQQPTQAPPLSL